MARMRGLLAVAASLAVLGGVSGCGSDPESEAEADAEGAVGSTAPTEKTTSTTATTEAPAGPGPAIAVPVCEFIGVTDADASATLGFEVASASTVGDQNPDGGRCVFTATAPAGGAFDLSVAVFPDTEQRFGEFAEGYVLDEGPTGRRLWTDLVEVDGPGVRAVSFKSPDGGWDNFWFFAAGYRVLLNHDTPTDVEGAPDKLRAVAELIDQELSGS